MVLIPFSFESCLLGLGTGHTFLDPGGGAGSFFTLVGLVVSSVAGREGMGGGGSYKVSQLLIYLIAVATNTTLFIASASNVQVWHKLKLPWLWYSGIFY